MNFFSILYSWLVDWYGTDLDNFLSDSDEGMNYLIIGVVTIALSAIIAALYYKIIDKPRWLIGTAGQ